MMFALIFFHFLVLLLACASEIDLSDRKSFKKTMHRLKKDFQMQENSLKILKMPSIVKDRIGVQRFGPVFEAFDCVPERQKYLAICELLRTYHFCLASLPPKDLLDPLIAKHAFDQYFLDVIQDELKELEKSGPGFERMRLKKSPLICTQETLKEMSDFLDNFNKNRDAFQAEIDFMFPIPASYEDALKDAIASILLIQKAYEDASKSGIRLFPAVYGSSSGCKSYFLSSLHLGCVNIYACNKLLNLMDAGLRKGDRKAVALVHGYFSFKHPVRKNAGLPDDHFIVRALDQIRPARDREFARWKIFLMIARNRSLRDAVMPESHVMRPSYVHGYFKRITLSLGHFLSEKEAKIKIVPDLYPVQKFEDALKAEFKEAAEYMGPKEARMFYTNILEREIPKILKSSEEFADYMDLDDERMSTILKAIREDDEAHPNFMDFGGAKYFDHKAMAEGESSECKADLRRAKRTKRRREKKLLALQNHASKTRIKQKPRVLASESFVEPADVMVIQSTVSPIIGEEPVIEDKALDKEEASDESKSHSSSEETNDSSPPLSDADDEEDDEYEKIREEWKQIEDEQIRVIEHYKLLAKLENAKLRHKKIKFHLESKSDKEKPHVVAFFRTDDFRLLYPAADELYEKNVTDGTAATVLNSGNSVFLKWLFNPAVIIDKHDYKFLCQLFGLTRPTNFLNFDNFLRTFQVLNPNKSMLNRKELARSVFQFEHVFETEDQVFVPPIGGGHREHLSSAFNHDQIRRFMRNGGAHPYFFELIKQK